MKFLIAIFLFILFTEVSIAQDSFHVPIDSIRIDPNNYSSGRASQILDEVHYIPLQTNKESLFGRIDKLEVTDKYYIILDKQTNAILFFHKDGSFFKKINKFSFDLIIKLPQMVGLDHSPLFSFNFDQNTNLLYVQSIFERSKLYVYNLEGEKVNKISLSRYTADYISLQKNAIWGYLQRPLKRNDTISHLPYDIFYAKNIADTELHYLFPINFETVPVRTDIGPKSGHFFAAQNKDECYYLPDLNSNIYTLKNGAVSHIYHFTFPLQYTLPEGFDKDTIYNGKRIAFLNTNDAISNILQFYKINNYLIFSFLLKSPAYNGVQLPTLLYNIKTGSLISLDNISPDPLTSFIPISVRGRGTILDVDNNQYLYFSCPSLFMFDSYDENKDKNPIYSPVLQKYFNAENVKSNPVIVQVKLKDNL